MFLFEVYCTLYSNKILFKQKKKTKQKKKQTDRKLVYEIIDGPTYNDLAGAQWPGCLHLGLWSQMSEGSSPTRVAVLCS